MYRFVERAMDYFFGLDKGLRRKLEEEFYEGAPIVRKTDKGFLERLSECSREYSKP